MLEYFLRRVLSFVPTIFITLTSIFFITRLIPGSPIAALIGHQAVSAEQIDALTSELGLDRSLIDQYLEWLPGVLTGDFGSSLFYEDSVALVVMERFPVTLYLTIFSMIVTIVIGIPLGIYASIRRGRVADYGSNVFSSLGMAMPSFWLGFLLIILFAVTLDWLPASGYRSPDFGIWEWLKRLILPVMAQSLAQIGLVVRMTRASMIEVLSQEYITMARAKGLPESRVVLKHGLKNAMTQITTVIGLTFALGLGGSVIIENVFALPGLGQLITIAAVRRDYAMLEGGIFYLTMVALVVNLAVDLAYAYFNPRIRHAR